MSDNYKEVYYGEYCRTCKHETLSSDDKPCDECLDNPMNVDSHKPVKWKEKGK